MASDEAMSALLLTKQLKGASVGDAPNDPAKTVTLCGLALENRGALKSCFARKTELSKNPVDGFSAGLVDDSDLYLWEIMVMGPPETLYEGGFFKAHLQFPKDYPQNPPEMTFKSSIFHPNGELCTDEPLHTLNTHSVDSHPHIPPCCASLCGRQGLHLNSPLPRRGSNGL
jgi:hypothetical protein